MTERLHWKDAEDAASWLKGRPADLRTFSFAAWLPFADAYLIEDLVRLNGGASIYRCLARLRKAHLLASIRPPVYLSLTVAAISLWLWWSAACR